MFASWLAFLIPAAYLSVHAPDAIARGMETALASLGYDLSAATITTIRYAVSAILFLLSAVLFSGYLSFGFAPQFNRSAVPMYLLALGTCGLCFLIYPFSAWVWGEPWRAHTPAGLFVFVAWLIYVLGAIRAKAGPGGRNVLFLRRFDSFADLSILPALLRMTPRGVPVATLVSGTENEIGYWDPGKLMAYGLHNTGVFGGRPVFQRGGADWETLVAKLLASATVVVMDLSDVSDAIAKEMTRVAKSGKPVIVIGEGTLPSDLKGLERLRALRLEYRRDARDLALRMALVLAIVLVIAILVDLPAQIAAKNADGKLWEGLFGVAVMLAVVTTYAGGLLLRKGLSRRAKLDLRAAIGDGLRSPAGNGDKPT